MSAEETATCLHCKLTLSLADFNHSKREKGVQSWCRKCYAKYYQENRSRITERSKLWKQKNRERVTLAAKRWRARNPEKLELARKWNQEYHRRNKERIAKRKRLYHLSYPGKRVAYKLKNRYGLSLEEFRRLIAAQNNLCLICGQEFNGGKRRPSVDHCHKTGVVRGILCWPCNHALGMLADDPNRLKAALVYLRS